VSLPPFFKDSTGKERDAETGLDFFLARYYSGAHGRFLSPDEFKGGPDDALTGKDIIPPGPLPYADIGNPQSLNKYVYVLNNPLRYIDPDGHEEWPGEGSVASGFGKRIDPFTGIPAFHNGVDIRNPLGHDVHTAADGIVISTKKSPNGANQVIIKNDDNSVYVSVNSSTQASYCSFAFQGNS
jgi:RHS repeat-associated protein